MRTKVTLVLVFLNVALFFFIFKFERSWRTETLLREARRRVLGSETATIRTLAVTNNLGGASFALVRNRDTWTLTQPLDWPANPDAVHAIIQELQFLENETSFSVADLGKNGQTLADYGLDKPKMTVTFTSSEGSAAPTNGQTPAGPTTVMQIGDATRVGNRLYVLSPDGTRIHVVSRSLIDALSVPLDQLRADTLLTIRVFEARALTVQSSGARVRIALREGGRWMFDTILVDARASKTAMDLTISALNQLHAASFPDTPPVVLPSASPTLRVTIDGNGRSETLFIGDPVKAPATTTTTPGGKAKNATEFYAQLMNGNSLRAPVFTVAVDNDLLEHLRRAQTDLRERRLLDLDASLVTSITLSAPNQNPANVTLQRLEANSPDSVWQLARPSDGAAGQQTAPADTAAVRRLLDRLTLLSAARFESDAPSSAQNEAWGFNRPEREITLVKSDGSSTLLQLGTDVNGGVYARVGTPKEPGSSVYAVEVDLAGDFPVDPKVWRDHTLRSFPATARIAAVKLTDLSNRQVVFETTFDAEGHAATAPANPDALRSLVSNLRVLRAKRFVQDGFPERVMLAGDERPWRYQLDTTVILPAGGGDQTNTSTLLFTERVGGAQQLAGSKELNLVFEIEQPMLDALWALTYGARDPGPPAEKK